MNYPLSKANVLAVAYISKTFSNTFLYMSFASFLPFSTFFEKIPVATPEFISNTYSSLLFVFMISIVAKVISKALPALIANSSIFL